MKKTFCKIPNDFWTTPQAKQLREAGAETSFLACYLLTSPHATMLGIYYLPLEYASLDTGLALPALSSALATLIELDFCRYDASMHYIWVVDMVRYRTNDQLSINDKQIKGIHNLLENLPPLSFLTPFYDKYSTLFYLPEQIIDRNPFEGSSKALASKQKKKQKQKNILSLSGQPDGARVNHKKTEDTPLPTSRDLRREAQSVLDFLNEKTGRAYRPVDTNLKLITARLRSGATVLQCRQVIAKKAREWQGRAEMTPYLRPATLFNATKFEQYVGELVLPPDDPSQQAEETKEANDDLAAFANEKEVDDDST